MTAVCLAFALGAAALQWQPELPGFWTVSLLLFSAALAFFKPRTTFVFAFLLGFFWAAWLAHLRMADWLAPALEGRDLQVVGVVAGLPATGERGQRFELDVESGDAGLPKKLLVSWYRAGFQEEDAASAERGVHPGERWLFTVRLRRPHGSVNPHGLDYEAWLLERGIGATGYVRNGGISKKIGERKSILDLIELARESIR